MTSRKDYARKRRNNAAATRTSTRSKKKAASKNSFPFVLIIITLILLSALCYGLYYLIIHHKGKIYLPDSQSQPIKQHSPAPRRTQTVKPSAKQQSTGAPVEQSKPDVTNPDDPSHFDFYEMLKQSEVKTPTVDLYKSTPKTAKMPHKYLLQTGSFKTAADAERMRAKLLLLGFNSVFTNTASSANGEVWYRVRVGPFENRSELAKSYDRLVEQNIQPLRVKLNP